jgi:hypothetical protein
MATRVSVQDVGEEFCWLAGPLVDSRDLTGLMALFAGMTHVSVALNPVYSDAAVGEMFNALRRAVERSGCTGEETEAVLWVCRRDLIDRLGAQ